ncbi:MAG: hypothetical protein Q7R60_04305 [bacterium]|nr:hypothetical protein [bacterium]
MQREVQKLAELRDEAVTDIRSSLVPPQLATVTAETSPDYGDNATIEPSEAGFLDTSFADTVPGWATTPAPPALDSVPAAVHPVGHIISPSPAKLSSESLGGQAPPPVIQSPTPQPTNQTLKAPLPTFNFSPPSPPAQPITSPLAQPLTPPPVIQSLETNPTGRSWQQPQSPWQIPSPPIATNPIATATPPPNLSLVNQITPASASSEVPVPELGGIPTPPQGFAGGSRGPSPFNFFSHRPILTGLGFVTIITLVSGAFALFSLLSDNKPNATDLSSQNDEAAALSAKDAKLTLNLDTILAKGKSLTLGQLIAEPTTGVLQLAGNFTASGTLAANGGSTFANNSGLVIDKITVCTSAGCIPNVNIPTITGSTGTAAPTAGAIALLNANNQVFTGNNRFSGAFLSQDSTNSATAFQIQNAAGTSNLLVANTISSRIGIGTATPAYTLDVNGDINSTTGIRLNGALLCNASGCTAAGGSNNYVQNGTALQSANFNIQSASVTSVTGTIRAATGQTADLLQLKDQAGVNILTIGPTGNTLFQASTDSVDAFSVQNAAGTSHLIGGDTLNARVAIAKPTPPDYTLDVGGDINSTTGLRVAGNLVCSTTCTPGGGSGNYIQNGTTLQTANYAIQSDLNTHIAAYIRGASGQSADLLQLVSGDGGTIEASFGATGNTTFKNSVNSTSAFQIQNAAGAAVFNVDTTNGQLAVGPSAVPANGVLTIGTNTTTAAGGIIFGTDTSAELYRSASGIITASGNLQARRFEATSATADLFIAQSSDVGTRLLLTSRVSGGAANMFVARVNGQLLWGDGTAVLDTNLYRGGAGLLQTDNNLLIKTTTDSTTAFQVQNAASNPYLLVNTSGASVSLGNTSIASTIQIGNTTGGVAQTIAIGNNATALSTSAITIGSLVAASSLLLQSGTGFTTIMGGNVGINDATPGYKLSVISSTANDRTISGVNTATSGTNYGGYFATTGAASGNYGVYASAGGANTVNISLYLAALPISGTANYSLYSVAVAPSYFGGNIGIGQTNPQAALSLGSDAGTAAGGIKFGSAEDTNLYRLGVGRLKTDTNLEIGQDVRGTGDIFAGYGLANQIRLTVGTGPKVVIGDTSAAVASQAVIGGGVGPGSTPGITFGVTGAYNDTNLYRSTADTLKTDDSLIVATNLTGNGTVLFKNTADSTTAFQVQNAASNPYLLVNTSGASVSLGNTSIASTIQIGNTTGAVAQTINIGNNATALSTSAITIGNLLGTSTTDIQGGTGVAAINLDTALGGGIKIGASNAGAIVLGDSSHTGNTTSIEAGTAATALQIGNGNTAHGIQIGSNATGDNDILLGGANAGSTLTLEAGTAATAIQIGNGATAHGIQIGTGGAIQTVVLGSASSSSITTINAGTAGLNLGNNGIANTIQIGNTTGAVAQTINIGNNATALSTSAITIGNLLSTSATTIQGGTGASAIGLTQGVGGTITIGASGSGSAVTIVAGSGGLNLANDGLGANRTINIGATGTSINGSTISIATTSDATRVQSVTIGSTANASNAVTLYGGTGASAISLQAGTAGTISIGTTNDNVITLGSTTATNQITIGQSTATQIVNIANGITGAGSTKTVNIGTAQNNSTGITAINIGLNNTSTGVNTVTIKAGGSGASRGPDMTLTPSLSTALCSSLAGATPPVAGTAYAIGDCSSGPNLDYAEMYPASSDSDYGDIMVTSNEVVQVLSTDGYKVLPNAPKKNTVRLVKATEAYQGNVVGVMSLNYGDFSSTGIDAVNPADNPKPIALSGQVPVKISPSSDPIAVGDYITTSTDPGKGIKATYAGQVIGKALETWDPSSGKTVITVFVEQGYYPGPNPVQNPSDSSVLNISGTATIHNLTVTNIANIQTLVVAGDTVVQGTLTLAGHLIGNADTSGVIEVAVGTTSVDYNFASPYSDLPKVVVTPQSDPESVRYWTTKTLAGFTLHLSAPPPSNIKFDYLVQQ